ncbi:MAG: hypothetical protein ABEJ84_04320 [Halodesulfurarchaeum sp.]
MKDTNLAFDLATVALFALAGVVFLFGWLQSGTEVFLIVALAMILATVYTGYRVRKLYLR